MPTDFGAHVVLARLDGRYSACATVCGTAVQVEDFATLDGCMHAFAAMASRALQDADRRAQIVREETDNPLAWVP